jgi:flagellar biosynthetic protein FlhB
MLLMGLRTMLFLSLPIVILAAVVGGIIDFLQVGALFAPEAIKPKLDKLNPISGFKNMFSKKQFVELLKNLVKISVTGYVVFGVVRDAIGLVISTIDATVPQMMAIMGELITRVSIRVGLLLLVFSIFDVWWQRRSYFKDLMMTKDEVKREYKESEGDPHYKWQRKAMHQEILESAQVQAVKDADVVVTNPDHVAVALQYNREKDLAPRVLCRGIDTRAQTIKELAKQYDVPLMRNVPLAHALLRVDVGEEIPETLYDAVAEVLTFVYGLQQGAAAQAPSTPARSALGGN